MVRIRSLEEIDRDKLKELFEKRGHGILSPKVMNIVREILEGKHEGMEIHQCKCGELMYLESSNAKALMKKYETDDIPCKVCGKYTEKVLNWGILKRFKEITNFLDEHYVFSDRSAATLLPKDVETLDKMALGLFPTNTHAEMLVGYYDFLGVLSEHFPEITLKYEKIVSALFDEAKTKNPQEFEILYYSLLDLQESHKAELNIMKKKGLLDFLAAEESTKILQGGLQDHEEIDMGMAKIQIDLSTYKDTVEIKAYLDLLVNILNIIDGNEISSNPFQRFRLPPLKHGGRARRIKSLADKVESLETKLPFSLAHLYKTHLRNAIAHNEYEIRINEGNIVLTRYSETIPINEFERTFEELRDLIYCINSYLAEYQVSKLRSSVKNQGIACIVFCYTEPFLDENEKLHPEIDSDAQLNIYQYWNFATSEKGKRIFPVFNIRIEEKEMLVIDFGENGPQYTFEKVPEIIEWLEQIILTGVLRVSLITIAPVLPVFESKAITRAPVGKIMDVYFLDVNEKNVKVSQELIKDAHKFLSR